MACSLGVAILVGLGGWQLDRRVEAAHARAVATTNLALPPFDAADPPEDLDYRRAFVVGEPASVEMAPGRRGWLDLGTHLLARVNAGKEVVLLDLGWMPASAVPAWIAAEKAHGPRTWSGVARRPAAGAGPSWLRLDPKTYGATRDFWIQEGEEVPAEAENPDREPPIGGWRAGPEERPHGEYAATWFTCAALLSGVWLMSSLRDPVAAGRGSV